MSFGFGFALPAYQLRGGGGNNPFNQNGPTLDLSFAGTVTDASNPNGYTLNTNFITPQYQIAAQYVVWETGVGLVDKTFSQIITFSRASGATWFNSAGNLIGVDFSTSSNTIGTGSKTFTLDATAGVNRSWATGDSVLIVDQANSANNMTGAVTSYTASTQALVVNVTSTAGSGTIASWRIGNLMQRLDYNPATLAAQGLLIEEQRTNSIRNNTMQGAVAGTPGTGPTNWVVPGTVNGLTQTISVGTENGIAYVDFRYAGTTTASSSHQISFESANQIAAASGQTWTRSAWFKTQAGSTANVTVNHNLQGRDAGNTTFTETFVTDITASLTGTLTRLSTASTLANASTAFVRSAVTFVYNNGVAIDITLRIGLPQLEQGAFATSVIPTTTTALTRSADVGNVNNLAPWFNSTAGTLFAESFRTTTAAVSTFPSYAEFDNGTTTRYGVYSTQTASTNEYRSFVIDAGVAQADIGGPASRVAAGTVVKQAAAFAANDFALSVNGSSVFTDTAGTLPGSVNRMSIGSSYIAANFANAWIRRITYYPRRLSNAELQAITA